MVNDFNNFQYDSCVFQGICSINPRTSSLQEILILYLKLTSYYTKKIINKEEENICAKRLILNTISVMVSNPEFSEKDFQTLIESYNKLLPNLIKEYEDLCEKTGEKPDYYKSIIKYNKKTNINIIKSIKLGEKEYLKAIHSLPQKIINLYKIIFFIAKSLCTSVLDLETYNEDTKEGFVLILDLLNSLDTEQKNCTEIKNIIKEASKQDVILMSKIRKVQEKRYGYQRKKEVSYTTIPNKAILVVGSNIKELEDILEAVKDTDIDVYTHDEMMLAHTFPKFEEYKNLKGQYGHGMENCLLDFATFPGPIILTRHSLYNVEHLYRGILYTTDFAYSKGVIQIKNKDFSDVIKSSLESKGFKTGKLCKSEELGFNYKKITEEIVNKIQLNNYSNIFIINFANFNKEQNEYYKNFVDKIPDNNFIISLSFKSDKNNVFYLNACFDTFAIIKIYNEIKSFVKIPVYVFFPECDRHTISKLIYFSEAEKINTYVGNCIPIILNPNLKNTLQEEFNIKSITTPKQDLNNIFGE